MAAESKPGPGAENGAEGVVRAPALGAPAPRAPGAGEAGAVVRRLSGRLRCLRCRYDLAGLSVVGVCPECGLPVRATILAAVDPYASELQRIPRPRLVAAGLLVWSGAGLAAALLSWGLRLRDVADLAGLAGPGRGPLIAASTVAILLSGLGALALVRPHAGIAPLRSLAVVLGAALYGPLAGVHWWVHAVHDPAYVAPYLEPDDPRPARIVARIAMALLFTLILILLRPNFRLLAARSLLLRMGRVERQAINAIVAAIVVGVCGDLLRLGAVGLGEPYRTVALAAGTFGVAVGAMLVTFGLAGIVLDVVRIVPVVLEPLPSLEDVVEDEVAAGAAP